MDLAKPPVVRTTNPVCPRGRSKAPTLAERDRPVSEDLKRFASIPTQAAPEPRPGEHKTAHHARLGIVRRSANTPPL